MVGERRIEKERKGTVHKKSFLEGGEEAKKLLLKYTWMQKDPKENEEKLQNHQATIQSQYFFDI